MSEQSELIVKEEQQITNPVNDIKNVFQDKGQFDLVMRASVALSQSTIVPTTYQNKPQNCFIAINLAGRMGVDPMIVMQNLYVVQGRPSWSGQACKMLIENCGKFTNIEHVYTGEKGKDNRGCYLQAVRKSDGKLIEGTEVTMEVAKKEGWATKAGSKWQTMPELMLAYRAAAFFARVHCPESLMGMQTAEENEDIAKEKRKVEDVL